MNKKKNWKVTVSTEYQVVIDNNKFFFAHQYPFIAIIIIIIIIVLFLVYVQFMIHVKHSTRWSLLTHSFECDME